MHTHAGSFGISGTGELCECIGVRYRAPFFVHGGEFVHISAAVTSLFISRNVDLLADGFVDRFFHLCFFLLVSVDLELVYFDLFVGERGSRRRNVIYVRRLSQR